MIQQGKASLMHRIVLCVVAGMVGIAFAQTGQAAGGRLAFEVASVRQSAPNVSTRGTEFLLPFDVTLPKGGLFSANARLIHYIGFAYKIVDTSQYKRLMDSLPDWARDEQFDIRARAEGNPTTDEVRMMMRALLESRFRLTTHMETRQLPVYALILERPGQFGPRMQMHPPDVACPEQPDRRQATAAGAEPPPHCGMDGWLADGRLHQRMINVTMDEAASFLGGAAGFVGGREHLQVFNETGIREKVDLNFEFIKDASGPDVDAEASGPTFTSALKHQLGLKLVKTTRAASVFVIDHIEKPSEN